MHGLLREERLGSILSRKPFAPAQMVTAVSRVRASVLLAPAFRRLCLGTSCISTRLNEMQRLYPVLLEHRLSAVFGYFIVGSIMFVCAAMQLALQMQTGFPGYFLLLPGIFLSALVFEYGAA